VTVIVLGTGAGIFTTATWVATPLIVVGTVEVYPTLPEVTVTVLGDLVVTITTCVTVAARVM
jgi:hypothetical protein